jgi:hypothetical protein
MNAFLGAREGGQFVLFGFCPKIASLEGGKTCVPFQNGIVDTVFLGRPSIAIGVRALKGGR